LDEEIEDEEAEDGWSKAPKLRMVDMLPKSLKRLGLCGCGEGGIEVLDQVREVMERKEELVPDLELITLNYQYSTNLSGEPYVYSTNNENVDKKLKEDCEAAGLELIIGLLHR